MSTKKKRSVLNVFKAFSVAGLVFVLAACGAEELEYQPPVSDDVTPDTDFANRDTIFGKGGLTLFDDGGDKSNNEGGALGVNSFLWRASLDTLSFMPMSSADPFGGVIITDWHSTPEVPSERFKLNVYILGKSLRADGIRVAVFSQRRDATGGWIDSAVPGDTSTQIEDAILTRARQIRRQAIEAVN